MQKLRTMASQRLLNWETCYKVLTIMNKPQHLSRILQHRIFLTTGAELRISVCSCPSGFTKPDYCNQKPKTFLKHVHTTLNLNKTQQTYFKCTHQHLASTHSRHRLCHFKTWHQHQQYQTTCQNQNKINHSARCTKKYKMFQRKPIALDQRSTANRSTTKSNHSQSTEIDLKLSLRKFTSLLKQNRALFGTVHKTKPENHSPLFIKSRNTSI